MTGWVETVMTGWVEAVMTGWVKAADGRVAGSVEAADGRVGGRGNGPEQENHRPSRNDKRRHAR